MNTKFSFALLVIVIALFAAACSPADTSVSVPMDPAQPAENEIVAPVPNTGDSAAEAQRLEAESRLFSGEIFLSDTDSPDVQRNIQTDTQPGAQNGCMSEDSQPRPYSGCVE